MQIIGKGNTTFLGHKRKEEQIKIEDNEIIKSSQKPKEKLVQKTLLKKPKLIDLIDDEKNIINLYENKEEKDHIIESNHNQTINSFNMNMDTLENNICEICGEINNVITFNSFRSILEYLTAKKIIYLFKNSVISEKYYNLKYNKLRMICSNCLINLSKNQIEFEKFFKKDKLDEKGINHNPFDNLFDNVNLKNFNNKEKINKNNEIISPLLQDKIEENPPKKITSNKCNTKKNLLMNSELNNNQLNHLNNNNSNAFINPNLNIGYVNTLNSQFIPFPSYNMYENQNIGNTTIPNYYNNMFDNNNVLNNMDFKQNNNINKSKPLQYYVLNYPDLLKVSHIGQPIGFISINNNIPYFYNIPSFNKNISLETNNEINPNFQIINHNEKDKNIQEISNKDNKFDNKDQNQEPNSNNSKNITEIQNKDFDEIFESVSGLYHKLLNIKIFRDFNLDLIGQYPNQNQNLFPNYLGNNITNVSFNNTISKSNQNNDIKNNNFKESYLNNKTNVNNFMNIPVVNGVNKDSLSKENEFNNVYIQNNN